MMIEADVSLGTLSGHPGEEPFPVMAHPPETVSDLSLQMFVDTVVQVWISRASVSDQKNF
jgi:hypothetical protein